MSKESLWFGYLEIGDKSSPVAQDPKLSTGKTDTLYLFNLQRNAIIEYKRDIVEPKLRPLNGNEADITKELKKAFKKIVKEFTPRGKPSAVLEAPPAVTTAPKKKPKEEALEEIGIGDVDDDFFDDGDDED
ncbi:hypothetical protein Tel_02980 [Candidatus Tenderia electrophaga]|jgi:hypothetical protein|uniref:Uncharacterized protein n=1 Tax=Candidatus Tenderia electrophaga TaxID=1748243 RepID=A0A0S2TAM6_9GAMM|nr:hypothetical protein Tel_02980 [Candidatus Tenderia electrophaga]